VAPLKIPVQIDPLMQQFIVSFCAPEPRMEVPCGSFRQSPIIRTPFLRRDLTKAERFEEILSFIELQVLERGHQHDLEHLIDRPKNKKSRKT
jgi:hypothetical protein